MTVKTPIAFLIFNRPDHTRRVFEEIRRAKPRKLLVVCDGSRDGVEGEAEKVQAVRDIVLNGTDWECDVLTNFSEKNLGCKIRVSSGLDWVFEQVEEAIILEDDCLPDTTFFSFCEQLLEKYRNNDEIMHIGGACFQEENWQCAGSYYFSRYNHIWGWATWRRAWRNYDVNMKKWKGLDQKKWLKKLFEDPAEQIVWRNVFNKVSIGLIDTWDFQWHFAMWNNNGLAVIPVSNLISNIGFDEEATHTRSENNPFGSLNTKAVELALIHPLEIQRNKIADLHTKEAVFRMPSSCLKRIKFRLGSGEFWTRCRRLFRKLGHCYK